MDPLDTARRTAEPIGSIPANFMLDGATYEHGAGLGFDGIDFYVAGRGGALGAVPGPVVSAAFVFFNPDTIAERWARGTEVMAPTAAAGAFIACGHRWAEEHLPDGVDYERLAELEARVISSTSPACVPLFAAWQAMAEPASPRALALQRMNVLRELRGGLHGASVVAAGLEPLQALMVKTPFMAGLFGWSEPLPDPSSCKAMWEQAEEATDRAMARSFAALDERERSELAELLTAALG